MDIAFLLGCGLWSCGVAWMIASRRRGSDRWRSFRGGQLHPGQGMLLAGAVLLARGIARFIAPSSGEVAELMIGLAVFFLIYITSIRFLGAGPDPGQGPNRIRA